MSMESTAKIVARLEDEVSPALVTAMAENAASGRPNPDIAALQVDISKFIARYKDALVLGGAAAVTSPVLRHGEPDWNAFEREALDLWKKAKALELRIPTPPPPTPLGALDRFADAAGKAAGKAAVGTIGTAAKWGLVALAAAAAYLAYRKWCSQCLKQ